MIKEKVLREIIQGIEFNLTGIAKEIDPQKFPGDNIKINGEVLSLKYLRDKTMSIKTHLEWFTVEMEKIDT